MWMQRLVVCSVAFSACLGTGLAVGQQQQQSPDRTITAQPGSTPPVEAVGTNDKKFLNQAAIGDMAEVELGQLAEEQSTNPSVKAFGQRMVKDHSQADDQLKGVAQSQHVSLPTSLDPKHKDTKERLSKLTGSKFDQAYMTLMVQEHTKAVNQYQQEAQNGHDPTVKGFAKQSVPLLKSHLKEAKDVEGKLKKS